MKRITKIRVHKTKGPVIHLTSFMDGKNGRIVSHALEQKKRRILRKEAAAQYLHALSEVKYVLSNPLLLSGTGGGARSIRFIDGNGKARRVVTGHWPELTKKYRRQTPISTRMWRKRGRLASYVGSDVKPRSSKVTVRKAAVRPASRRNRVRVMYAIQFSQLPNPVLNRLIAEPFVHGNKSIAAGFRAFRLDRTSSELLGYPEAAPRLNRGRGGSRKGPVNRPFIAQLTGKLGREMHRSLRKL